MDAAALHATLLALDTHIDIPWPTGPDFFADSPRDQTGRRVDLPKMRAGGMKAGCFAAYVPQGPRTPDGWQAASNRALAMLDAINAMGRDAEGGSTRVASTADAIEAARRNAQEAGLADRVTFTAADASGPGVQGQYDLVTILEALHDMSRPVDALRVARGLLAEPGCVIVADELVEEEPGQQERTEVVGRHLRLQPVRRATERGGHDASVVHQHVDRPERSGGGRGLAHGRQLGQVHDEGVERRVGHLGGDRLGSGGELVRRTPGQHDAGTVAGQLEAMALFAAAGVAALLMTSVTRYSARAT